MEELKLDEVPGVIETKLEEIETKDIYFAAALHSLEYEYLGVDKTDCSHQKFKFRGKDLKFQEQQWVNNTLIGNLSIYADSIRRFKSIIHSQD